jgi:hypothetical protein
LSKEKETVIYEQRTYQLLRRDHRRDECPVSVWNLPFGSTISRVPEGLQMAESSG